jgi:hypothetical protein
MSSSVVLDKKLAEMNEFSNLSTDDEDDSE